MMNGHEKSDHPIVPKKGPNNAGRPAAEGLEERGWTKGNSGQRDARRTTEPEFRVPNELARIRHAARRARKAKFTALLHHVSVDRLREAYRQLKPKAAPGVDALTWKEYGQTLEERLQDLHGRIHRGSYRAKPSRRVYIPKADGTKRPLGIAAVEDKVLQRAVAQVLNAIYEEDFLGFSYGFRPGRSQHQALDALAVGIKYRKVNWVLDTDIRGFFDAIDHEWLIRFVEHRIGDRRVVRLIRKWLKAGVLEGGKKLVQEKGTPQGATISPLLANLYLHYVFDFWAHHWRQTKAKGDVVIARYADDIVMGFENRGEAMRFQKELGNRFRKFNLELHPEKTRLIQFGRFAAERRKERGQGKPETFDFLGMTHVCGKTKQGGFQIIRHTQKRRMRAKLKDIKEKLRRRMHLPIPAQGIWLRSVITGYFNYHAVPSNGMALSSFRKEVARLWKHSLRRRSQRDKTNWERMARLVKKWLPHTRIRHPWPEERFVVMTRGRSPVR